MTTGKTTRWYLWLPLLSVVLTSLLLAWASLQDGAFFHANPGSRGYLALHYAPAWTFAALVNGPAFLLGGILRLPFNEPFVEFGRVLTAAVFWFFVGFLADARNCAAVPGISARLVLKLVLQFMLIVLAALALLGGWHFSTVTSLRLWGLRSPIFMELAMFGWLLATTIFFVKNVGRAMRFPAADR
jgi:hypothetical protein